MKWTSFALIGLAIVPLLQATATLKTEQSQFGSTTSGSTALQTLEEIQSKKSAQQWGLTTEEWQRYQQLRQGRRGILSPGLDPITMLGVEARSEEERRYYAELSVRLDFQRVEAELAFQREVNFAWERAYPDILPVQVAGGNLGQGSHRLALFIRTDCGTPCENKVASLLASLRPLDIYLVGSNGKDETVRTWARKLAIPVERVKAKTVTLNHDRGQWIKFGQGRMPVVLQQGENGWQVTAH
ncbi:TIGR03759 family integrating conjugative element protein [Yersinia bercovieri]|uniref:TIGR03759 family integrating conjugative element protein n=1 Tax=Yersinia bercovieri TaxID=634 RepID=UPI0005E4F5EC|nr:TIGR03759 family integrating conjugative element protein [Yersinia bercovieri]MCB5303849.1 TIGR03759 family integrating conjugative element protein [Yersinia bercovieri]CFQ34427.1 integrating conjugative element protein%2C PFL_4693 family [Yersinia bercovieri]HEN3654467.1 TIGR03759 family integrating conjugative element protein [Yersinia enterocolitica]